MLLEPPDCLFYKCDLHQLITSLKKKKTLLKENEQISRTWLAGSLTLVDTEKAACARRAFPTPPSSYSLFPDLQFPLEEATAIHGALSENKSPLRKHPYVKWLT